MASGRRRLNWSVAPRALYADAVLSRYSRLPGASANRRWASSRERRAACSAGSSATARRAVRAIMAYTSLNWESSSVSAGLAASRVSPSWLARDNAAFVSAVLPCGVPEGRDVVQDRHERAPWLRDRHVRRQRIEQFLRAREAERPRPPGRRGWGEAGRPGPSRPSGRRPPTRAPAPDRCRHPGAGSRGTRAPSARSTCAHPSRRAGSRCDRGRQTRTSWPATEPAGIGVRRGSPRTAPRRARSTRLMTTSAAATVPARCRRRNLPARYAAVLGRARTGRPSRYRPRSSLSAAGVPYRRSGSLRIAVRTIVSRSPRSLRRPRPAGPRGGALAGRRRLVYRRSIVPGPSATRHRQSARARRSASRTESGRANRRPCASSPARPRTCSGLV